jgi:hypothetical protein
VPETRTVYNNTCRDILAVAAEMLNGEIEYRKGNYEEAFNHLHGYVECLTRQGKHAKAAAAQASLNVAMAHADVHICLLLLSWRKIMLSLRIKEVIPCVQTHFVRHVA